jgi:hypothetical protein
VDYESGLQAKARGDLRIASLAPVEVAAGFEKLRARRAVNRAIDASTAEQR